MTPTASSLGRGRILYVGSYLNSRQLEDRDKPCAIFRLLAGADRERDRLPSQWVRHRRCPEPPGGLGAVPSGDRAAPPALRRPTIAPGPSAAAGVLPRGLKPQRDARGLTATDCHTQAPVCECRATGMSCPPCPEPWPERGPGSPSLPPEPHGPPEVTAMMAEAGAPSPSALSTVETLTSPLNSPR